jgi:hypothetical protein
MLHPKTGNVLLKIRSSIPAVDELEFTGRAKHGASYQVKDLLFQKPNQLKLPNVAVVLDDSNRLCDYAWNDMRLVLKRLNHRRQRRNYNWTTFEKAWERWRILPPQVFEQSW